MNFLRIYYTTIILENKGVEEKFIVIPVKWIVIDFSEYCNYNILG